MQGGVLFPPPTLVPALAPLLDGFATALSSRCDFTTNHNFLVVSTSSRFRDRLAGFLFLLINVRNLGFVLRTYSFYFGATGV